VWMWVVVLLWGECLVFWSWKHEQKYDAYTVAIVADPQLTDFHSYNQNPGVLLDLTEFYSDLYMRRAYRFGVLGFNPNSIMFLGDLFDGGRLMPNENVFMKSFERFQSIFGDVKSHMNGALPEFLFAAGNHDIGLGPYYSQVAADRFRSLFGKRTYDVERCSVPLVVVDSVALTHQEYYSRLDADKKKDVNDVYKLLDRVKGSKPLLFSHIPLYRRVKCDPSLPRSTPFRHWGRGVSYQNMLSEQVSMDLLQIKPEFIFSGDDHSACLVEHDSIPEYTTPTFSWLQGVSVPAFSIVSMRGCNDLGGPTIDVEVHSLPNQLRIYKLYACVLALTIVVLVLDNIRSQGHVFVRRPSASSLEEGRVERKMQVISSSYSARGLSRRGSVGGYHGLQAVDTSELEEEKVKPAGRFLKGLFRDVFVVSMLSLGFYITLLFLS